MSMMGLPPTSRSQGAGLRTLTRSGVSLLVAHSVQCGDEQERLSPRCSLGGNEQEHTGSYPRGSRDRHIADPISPLGLRGAPSEAWTMHHPVYTFVSLLLLLL